MMIWNIRIHHGHLVLPMPWPVVSTIEYKTWTIVSMLPDHKSHELVVNLVLPK